MMRCSLKLMMIRSQGQSQKVDLQDRALVIRLDLKNPRQTKMKSLRSKIKRLKKKRKKKCVNLLNRMDLKLNSIKSNSKKMR